MNVTDICRPDLSVLLTISIIQYRLFMASLIQQQLNSERLVTCRLEINAVISQMYHQRSVLGVIVKTLFSQLL